MTMQSHLPSKERTKAPSGILTSESSYLPRPSHPNGRTVANLAAFVIGYSGGAVPDFHRLPNTNREPLKDKGGPLDCQGGEPLA